MQKYLFILLSVAFVTFVIAQEEVQIEIVFNDGTALRGFLIESNDGSYQVRVHQQTIKISKQDVAKVNKLKGKTSSEREDKIRAIHEEMHHLNKKTIQAIQDGRYEEAEKLIRRLREMQQQLREWNSAYGKEHEKKLEEERTLQAYHEKIQHLKKEVLQLQTQGKTEEAERLMFKIERYQQEWEKRTREEKKKRVLSEIEEKLHHLELQREEAKVGGRENEVEALSQKLDRVRREKKIVQMKFEMEELKTQGKFEEAERLFNKIQETKNALEQEPQQRQNRQWEEEIEYLEDKVRALKKQVAELEALGRVDEAKEVTRQIEQMLEEIKTRFAKHKKED